MLNFLTTLKRNLRSKISLLKEKRRRRNLGRKDSLYPYDVPLHLSQIDLGEELTREPSLISLQEAEQTGEPLSRVPSLTSLFSAYNFECEQEAQTDKSTELPANEEAVESPSQEMEWPVDTRRNVQLVELRLLDCKLSGTVMVANLAYHKNVFVRWTADNWASYHDQVASYDHSSDGYSHDWFLFSIDSPLLYQEGGVCIKLAVAYQVNGQEFWDNNQQQNFLLELSE